MATETLKKPPLTAPLENWVWKKWLNDIYNYLLALPPGASTITTQDEGVTLSTGVTTLNFVGAGVTASGSGATTTITIPGGGGGAGSIYFGPDPPAVPTDYVAWWNTEEGMLKVYYTDANTSQWVDATVASTGVDGADGVDGTNGQGVPTGGTAGQILSKIDATDYNTQWITSTSSSSPYWVTNHPLTPPTSPNAKDEEWNDAVGMSGPVNGLAAAWTTFGAAQTRSYKSAKLVLTGTASGGVSPNFTGMYKTAPATPYKVTVPYTSAAEGNYNYGGVGLRNSSSGKFVLMGCFQDVAGPSATGVQLVRYTNTTTNPSASTLKNLGNLGMIWLQIEYDGTNIIGRYSMSGVEGTFVQHSTELASTFFTGGALPDQFFIGSDPYNTITPKGVFGPVRVS